jgi:cytochrome P450
MTQACSNPKEFMPERYMDGANSENLDDPRDFVFGFGRRACPGQHFAEANLWLAIARIVATFDISKSLNAEGEEITPPGNFTEGSLR